MKRLLDFVFRRHQPDVEALSSHLDGQLDPAAAAALASHLAGCAACRARLDDLRLVRDSLRMLPDAAPSRSFHITRSMLETAPGRPAPPRPSLVRLAPALSAAAALVFAVVVAVDVYSSGGGPSAASLAREPGPSAQRMAASPAAGAAAAPESKSVAPPAPAAPSGTPAADAGSAFDSTPDGNSALSSNGNAANDGGDGTSGGRIALRIVEALIAAVAIGAAAVAIGRRLKERGAP